MLVLLMAGSTSADTFSPSHSCIKPYKPYRFTDEWEVTRFEGEVKRYKRCITDFVEEQNEEARRHQEAADDAIEEWNRFVRYELK
jgi:hypothetical protein